MVSKKVFLENLEILLKILKREISIERKSLKSLHLQFDKIKKQRYVLKNNIEKLQFDGVPFLAKIPLLGNRSKKNYLSKINSHIREYKKTDASLKKIKTVAVYKGNVIESLVNDGKSLQDNAKNILKNYDEISKVLSSDLMQFINKIEFLKRTNISNIKKESHEIIKSFNLSCDKLNVGSIPAPEKIPETTVKNDIVYLPIPIELRHEAKRLGAKYNPDGGFGSRMYVSLNEDADSINNMQSMLPIAYREKTEKFSFPPIRYHGKKQNLWSIFTKDTWNYIRSINYARSGNRCMICGNQGGKLIDSVYQDEKSKRYSVECHEIWEWDAPDLKTGIGIQKLKQILVVCVDCHMMFHEDFAINKAKSFGKQSEVEKFLRKRMMLVNHSSEQDLLTSLENERENAEKMNGVDKWIIDLSVLAEQDYMKNHIPVLSGENPAGVTVDMIAGIEFEDETGLIYEAIDAVDIYTSLISDLDKEMSQNAIPFEVNSNNNQPIKLKMF